MRTFKTKTKPGTKRRGGIHAPTIGVGEDAIRGRGPGQKMAALGKGGLGENIPQSPRDLQAIANIDNSQSIQTDGNGDEGTNDDNDVYD
jgi:hypothetical protein